MNENHTQLEVQRLETALDHMTRRHEAALDCIRSLQLLIDAIHIKSQGQDIDRETLFGNAYANAQQALRTYYEPNGPGR